VSPGVRNLVPLLLWILGTIIWGVQAAQLQHHVAAGADHHPPVIVQWRDTTLVSLQGGTTEDSSCRTAAAYNMHDVGGDSIPDPRNHTCLHKHLTTP
jgi:hypothetical protein